MSMLDNCSNCHTPLQLPPGAESISCVLCQTITLVADPRFLPPPSVSSTHHQQPPPPLQAPSPYNPAPPGQPPQVHGHKRAVICGVSYKNTKNELKGCINDANGMKSLLVDRFKFPESSIITLTEEETDPDRRPTKDNIRKALSWLVQGCQPGDSLVFHYSGHGSQQKNDTGDELDGYDETLCPSDFESEGMIVDDEINTTIVRPLPHGVKLHAIIDACHSGTVLDLPFLCRMDRQGRYVWEDHRPRSGKWKGTNGGKVFLFSGCDDHQTSADTSALSRISTTGAMTYSFIQAIEYGNATTYGHLLNAMRSTIRSTTEKEEEGCCAVLSFLATLFARESLTSSRSRQEPQLTASEPFAVEKMPFSL